MNRENLLGYMFLSLFIQSNVAKEKRLTTGLEKDKSNPEKWRFSSYAILDQHFLQAIKQ